MGRDSSVGIATRNGLAGPRIEPRWEEGEFFQIGPGTHSVQWDTGLFHGGKAADQAVALTTHHHHLAPRLKKEWSYTFTPFPEPSRPVIG